MSSNLLRTPVVARPRRAVRRAVRWAAMLLSLVAISLAASPPARANPPQVAAFKVVVNSSNPLSSVSKQDLSDMFMKRKTYWSNGAPVEPVDLVEESAARDAFSRAVLGKSVPAVRAFWNQMIFAGRGVPPLEKPSDNDVLQFVRSSPNAVGYVSAATKTEGVRVVNLAD